MIRIQMFQPKRSFNESKDIESQRSLPQMSSGLRIAVLLGVVGLRSVHFAHAGASSEPQLGYDFVLPTKAKIGLCMSSPGQMDHCAAVVTNGIKYIVGYRSHSARRNVVTYVHTDDPRFVSPNGLRVGDVATVANVSEIVVAPGFEIYATRGNEWAPVVGFNGEVQIVREGQQDEKRFANSINPTTEAPVHLRITGFTKRRGRK